jgi:hypothetical protein
MKEVIFLPQAEEEMCEAAIFYDNHNRGLGRAFLGAVKKGTSDISRHPI